MGRQQRALKLPRRGRARRGTTKGFAASSAKCGHLNGKRGKVLRLREGRANVRVEGLAKIQGIRFCHLRRTKALAAGGVNDAAENNYDYLC